MTDALPWAVLVNRRRALGMTQRELADGIVTQSLVSQIERGRVLPSERILNKMAMRLGLDASDVLKQWGTWRQRDKVRESLWLAALLSDSEAMERLLQDFRHLLVPFERCIYEALCAILHDNVRLADGLLSQAWSQDTMLNSGMAYGRKAALHHRDAPTEQGSFAGAWTRTDRVRAMVLEAKVQECLCRCLGKLTAASEWQGKVSERMRGAFGVGYTEEAIGNGG
jgi:transcriptional regulator with XRE-family HTH domain